jgi:hypothetical protein
LEALPELAKIFPEENRKAEEVKEHLCSPEVRPYTSVYNYTGEESETHTLTSYATSHPVGSDLMARIPNGRNLLIQARVSGKLAKLSKAVNQSLGPGAFKVVMHANPYDMESCHLLRNFLDATTEDERLRFGKEIITRAKEIIKHE